MHWAFPPTTGGVESHVADLSIGLARRGHDVTVLTGEHAPRAHPELTVLRSDLLSLERIRSSPDTSFWPRPDLLSELGSILRRVGPDVVHGHNLHHFSAGPALALDRLRAQHRFPVHHTFHETWPDVLHDEPVYRAWEGNYAVSRHVRDECARRIGFAPELRPLGIDTARFQANRPVLSGAGLPTILHPARLLPWKGVHLSVRMIGVLAERGIRARLIITDTARIADWDDELTAYRAEIVGMIERLGVGDLVELRAVDYSAMPALYEEADVVVYPTVAEEPYGLVPLEGMSCRRPVVASRSGGIPETIVDGVTGWIVPRDDVDAMATRVTQMLADPDAARRMGDAGRERVVEHFELERFIDAMEDSYRESLIAT
ncbi:hypothetical protein B1729_02580 [Microbacterium sp. B35-04]|nr:hypothetical protein B1729_02580 [Microbacterium sp. B35-04]